MSKGPGKVERALIDIFWNAQFDNAYTTEELCARIYGGEAGKKERVALIRGAKRLRQRKGYEDLHSMQSGNLGKTHVWYNRANLMSYAMARLKADSFYNYRSRDERCNWYRGGTTEQDLRAVLRGYDRQWIVPGGVWHQNVQDWITERDLRRLGRKKELKRFLEVKAARESADWAALVGEAKELMGKR